jgi:hypothetical protein
LLLLGRHSTTWVSPSAPVFLIFVNQHYFKNITEATPQCCLAKYRGYYAYSQVIVSLRFMVLNLTFMRNIRN